MKIEKKAIVRISMSDHKEMQNEAFAKVSEECLKFVSLGHFENLTFEQMTRAQSFIRKAILALGIYPE